MSLILSWSILFLSWFFALKLLIGKLKIKSFSGMYTASLGLGLIPFTLAYISIPRNLLYIESVFKEYETAFFKGAIDSSAGMEVLNTRGISIEGITPQNPEIFFFSLFLAALLVSLWCTRSAVSSLREISLHKGVSLFTTALFLTITYPILIAMMQGLFPTEQSDFLLRLHEFYFAVLGFIAVLIGLLSLFCLGFKRGLFGLLLSLGPILLKVCHELYYYPSHESIRVFAEYYTFMGILALSLFPLTVAITVSKIHTSRFVPRFIGFLRFHLSLICAVVSRAISGLKGLYQEYKQRVLPSSQHRVACEVPQKKG